MSFKLLSLLLVLLIAVSVNGRKSSYHSSGSSYHSTKSYSSPHHSSSYHAPKSYTLKTHTASYHSPSSTGTHSSKPSVAKKSSHHNSEYCKNCSRDFKGHIKRSEKAKESFKKSHPCPSTGKSSGPCPGYVIDHVKALKHGGADDPSNMQWQPIEAGKAKDKVE